MVVVSGTASSQAQLEEAQPMEVVIRDGLCISAQNGLHRVLTEMCKIYTFQNLNVVSKLEHRC